jgi:hypothetical protein
MTEADSDSNFLLEGLRHFPDAHATVSAFRRMVAEKVQDVLNSSRRDVWKPKDLKATRSESNGLWVGAGGAMMLESVPGKELVIDVGIWWKASHFKEPVNAVTAIYSATEIIGQRLDETKDADVHLVRNGSRQDLFFIALGNDTTDVEDAFRRVVEAAANAVASAIVAVKVSITPVADQP